MEHVSWICLNCVQRNGLRWWVGFRYDERGRLIAVWPEGKTPVNAERGSGPASKAEEKIAHRIRWAFEELGVRPLEEAAVRVVLATLKAEAA